MYKMQDPTTRNILTTRKHFVIKQYKTLNLMLKEYEKSQDIT